MKELNELADRELERGAFGNFNVPKKDEKGRPLAKVGEEYVIPERAGWWWNRHPGTPADASKKTFAIPATEVDKDAKAKAESAKRDTVLAVGKWRKTEEEKGHRPTREELFQKFNELMKGTVSASEADSFINGGGPDNAFFGFGPDAAAKLKGGLKK
jgi:hypothetical protein